VPRTATEQRRHANAQVRRQLRQELEQRYQALRPAQDDAG
jgi:hypothetical protein